jgi:Asp-tRNA(Asn)/Glu-tRNA(Gln) amidotransferase A subunit family amidase
MDPTELSAVELSNRIRRREISCREVMAKYLERIDAYNPTHNAIVNLRPARDILAESVKRDEQLSRGPSLPSKVPVLAEQNLMVLLVSAVQNSAEGCPG